MNSKVKNEIGNVYGRLTVVRRKGSIGCKAAYECLCECGELLTVTGDSLRQGKQKSCGCYRSDFARSNSTKHGHSNAGGLRRESKTYKSWQEMHARCKNEKHISYKNYGGRGVLICRRWEDFANFLADMGERPEHTSLDRIDNSLDYSHENCKWSDRKTQNNNRRGCHMLEFEGKTQTLAQWCDELGLSYMRTYKRYKLQGRTVQECFSRESLK